MGAREATENNNELLHQSHSEDCFEDLVFNSICGLASPFSSVLPMGSVYTSGVGKHIGSTTQRCSIRIVSWYFDTIREHQVCLPRKTFGGPYR